MTRQLELTNQKFGKLTAIKIVGTYKTKKLWECLCECGNTTNVVSTKLKNNEIQSCGCVQLYTGKHKRSYRGHGDISGYTWSQIKCSAKSRNHEFSISIEYAWNLYLKQDKKCALSNRPILFCSSRKEKNVENHTASLDRIDNTKGYIEDNVWWTHKDLNYMKQEYNLKSFIEMCGDVYLKNQNKIVPVQIPDWIDYFLGLAFVVSSRSKDAQTKHGCIITDQNNHIIGTGYNSFPRQSLDNILPNLRPEKYSEMTHSERNALSNLTISPWSIVGGGIAYVTGKPCLDCLYALWNTNINTIYAANRQGSVLESKDIEKFNFFITTHDINYKEINPNLSFLKEFN
jgi:dCMP deaminase